MSKSEESSIISAPVASAPVRRIRQGPVMPIGGAEDKADSNESILARFVEVAGGKKARIVVIPTASEEAEEMGQRYINVFGKMGASSVEAVDIKERSDANEPATLDLLAGATGIFITGGAQDRLVSLLVGTLSMECIRARNADGVVIAGTSAGASIVAAHVMLGGTGLAGDSNGAAARKAMVDVAAGFGLLQDIIVDQHFSQRGRMGRLLSAFASNPGLIGIGLDEDTAVLIDREGTLETLGSGTVTLIDGRNATSNYFDIEVGDVLTVVDSSHHILGPGQCFDLNERRPIPAERGDNQ